MCGIAAILEASSGRAYIDSASIMLSSASETIESSEYKPWGVVADRSILGMGRSASTSS